MALILLIPLPGFAAPWRSTLYPDTWQPPAASVIYDTDQFLQDFSFAGYRRGEAPLPTPSGPLFDVTASPYLADSSGNSDSTPAIQAAINAAGAAGGGVVYLPAGTYRIAPQPGNDYALWISSSHIVLRGAGAGQTHLLNTATTMRGKAILKVASATDYNWRSAAGAQVALTQDLTGPTQLLPVAKASVFHVGDWICVRNDITDAWINEHLEPDWLGQGAILGGIAYLRKVTAVNEAAGTISIDIPTRYTLKMRDNARVTLLPAPLEESGIEKLSIGNLENPTPTGWEEDDYTDPAAGAYACDGAQAISLQGVVNGWVRDVSSYQPAENLTVTHILSNGIGLEFCRSVTLQNCRFEHPQFGGGNGNGYMFRVQESGDNLLLDCTAIFARHGFIFSNMATSGNVLHRCLDKQTARYTGASGSMVASGFGSEHHMHFSHSNLVDSCTADSSLFLAVYRPLGSAPKHDLTATQSVFWNIAGTGDPNWPIGGGNVTIGTGNEVIASQQSGTGYVIGTRGTRTAVETGVYYNASASGSKTSPVDFVEGVGQADTLEPASLYADQLSRRTGSAAFRVTATGPAVIYPPASQALLQAQITSAPSAALLTGDTTYHWTLVHADGPATIASPDSATTSVTLGGFGIYTFEVTSTHGAQTDTDTATIELRGTNKATQVQDISVTSDATIRNGAAYVDTAYGASTILQMKQSNSDDFQREILLRFTLPNRAATDIVRADLILTPTSSTGSYSAQAISIGGTAWNELTVTWNNHPADGSAIGEWTSTGASNPVIDITNATRAALVNGEMDLALGLRVVEQAVSTDVITFRSREHTTGPGPKLRLTLLTTAASPIAAPPQVRIRTKAIRISKNSRVAIQGSALSASGIRTVTVRYKQQQAACRLSKTGTQWTGRLRLGIGRAKIIAVATDNSGLSATNQRVIVIRK